MSSVDNMILQFQVVYQKIAETREENFALFQMVQKKWVDHIRSYFVDLGYDASHLFFDRLFRRIDLSYPHPNPTQHIDLMRALLTDYTDRLKAHIVYRLKNGGNAAIEFTGPTGMAKSSCAIALADWIKAILPDRLLAHLVFDLGDLAIQLADKQPGDTVIVDEFLQLSGDGARTVSNTMSNIEDTIRASRINLFWCSPSKQDHSTSQCELELVLWNRKLAKSLFLVWVDGLPLGYAELPWAPAHLWKVYSAWKAKNTARSIEGKFRDTHVLGRLMVRMFATDDFVQYLLLSQNKPKRGAFEDAVELFNTQQLSTRQRDRLVSLMFTVCYAFDRLEAKFERMFGTPPNDGLREVAKRCYAE